VPIDAAMPYDKRHFDVLGSSMACVDVGEARPHRPALVFLHGNPTSSYLWRNVIPHVEGSGRCVAPDLIGMGDSAKLPGSGDARYRYRSHRRHLDALLAVLELGDRVVLVVHDWGSALGFDWARRHPDRVAGIAYMEAIVRPMSWDDWPQTARGLFQAMRSAAGQDLVLERNLFVERILPSSILRELTAEEHAAYRRPFSEPGESRRPTLTWPRELPIDGQPADVDAIAGDYARWLATSPVPKLFFDADPGAILTGAQREFCLAWPNQTVVGIAGSHFVQEDSPDEIGRALADWVAGM
jgi:haloalkane dehalogenase